MRFKDLVSIVKNKSNKQTNLSLKKRKLKELNISEEDLLNMKIDKNLRVFLK